MVGFLPEAVGFAFGLPAGGDGEVEGDPVVGLKALAAQRLFGTGAYFQVVNPRLSTAYRQAVELLEAWEQRGKPILEPKK